MKNCHYYGVCYGCSLAPLSYEEQIESKVNEVVSLLSFDTKPRVYRSDSYHYRMRMEFAIWHDGDKLHYAMHTKDKKKIFISHCLAVHHKIHELMAQLLPYLESRPLLRYKLFSVDFLVTSHDKVLLTMAYHKPLADEWDKEANEMAEVLGIFVVGRSRGVKRVIGQDWLEETLTINNHEYAYRYDEGAFSQPNKKVNESMISWVVEQVKSHQLSLFALTELYCGAGNFTFPLSHVFKEVFSTEVSKSSVKALEWGIAKNQITNINVVRLSAEEFTQALDGTSFNRLGNKVIPHPSQSVIFVDPPRAGLDDNTRTLLQRYPYIIYISCNPITLARDIQLLNHEFDVMAWALFDQFPYTHHIETGVILKKRG